MKILKSHFWYNKRQRNGIFFLLVIIVILQTGYFYVVFNEDEQITTNSEELVAFQKELDSLKTVELENRKPKVFPFNPNFITDFKGYQLGMSIEEIDRLHSFRKQNKYVNSISEFQQLTKVSDSLLNKISPYFKFPDWVIKRNQQRKTQKNDSKFRQTLNVSKTVSKAEKEEILKININTATFKEVLRIPGIDYELCKKIFDYRDEVAELQNISELRNIKDFPLNKYDRIILYLEAK